MTSSSDSATRVYVFVEAYPHPYKPYYDAQIRDLQQRGCDVTVVAFASSAAPTVRMQRMYAQSLRDVPKWLAPFALGTVRHLRERPRALARVINDSHTAAGGVRDILTVLTLPTREPSICIVHGLSPMAALARLPSLYPSSFVLGYYHGEKPPGAGTIDDVRARRFLSSADRILTNTQSSRETAVLRGADPDRCVIHPVGFDLELYPLRQTKYVSDGLLRVASVGRLSPEKGIHIALQAIAAIPDALRHRIRYRIIGDGPQRDSLAQQVTALGISGNVTFTGTLPHRAVIEEIARADVLLLPSMEEGKLRETQATVVQEAALLGTNVIAARVGGVPESTPPAFHDLMVDQRDESAIATRLIRLIQQPETVFAKCGLAARDWVAARYDIRKLNTEILDMFASTPAGGVSAQRHRLR